MTINKNNTTMGTNKNCIQLDATRKMKIKLDPNGNILYINHYFTEVTGFKAHELILQEFSKILSEDMPAFAQNKILDIALENDKNYFIIKGITKDGNCYWGFVRSVQEYNEDNTLKDILLEIKMLPLSAIDKVSNLYDILREINNNAGMVAAEKYFDGYLEDRNLDLKSYILAITETNEKKIDKYFAIDVDAQPVKKKKGWF